VGDGVAEVTGAGDGAMVGAGVGAMVGAEPTVIGVSGIVGELTASNVREDRRLHGSMPDTYSG